MVRQYKLDRHQEFNDNLLFWSNEKGDLHYHGERRLNICDLPEELRNAYRQLWRSDTGSYCYLVEYLGQYYIALSNEYSYDFAGVCEKEFSELYQIAFKNAVYIDTLLKENAEFILLIEGFHDKEQSCPHEMMVLLRTDLKKDTFNRIADILYEEAYRNC